MENLSTSLPSGLDKVTQKVILRGLASFSREELEELLLNCLTGDRRYFSQNSLHNHSESPRVSVLTSFDPLYVNKPGGEKQSIMKNITMFSADGEEIEMRDSELENTDDPSQVVPCHTMEDLDEKRVTVLVDFEDVSSIDNRGSRRFTVTVSAKQAEKIRESWIRLKSVQEEEEKQEMDLISQVNPSPDPSTQSPDVTAAVGLQGS